MCMLSTAVLSMQRESQFAKAYQHGMTKTDYWKLTLEDALCLLARLPQIAASIYRWKYHHEMAELPDDDLDFGASFAKMMQIDAPYDEVSRLFFILHSDHESGNVSAHAGHLVASTLSDVYYACSSMLNGLAGPLHGLASQEVLRWIQAALERFGRQVAKHLADVVALVVERLFIRGNRAGNATLSVFIDLAELAHV